MDRTEDSRLAWQWAQAELELAHGSLQRLVADELLSPLTIQRAREIVKQCQEKADEALHQHITNNDL